MEHSNNDLHQNFETNEKYSKQIDLLKNTIVFYNDFPKPGVHFKDTFSLLKNAETFQIVIDLYCDLITQLKPDVIIGLESRGFALGGAISYKLKLPFVPIRKKNKLPGPLKTVSYTLEYGENIFQIQENALQPGQKAVIIDDVIATGGTVKAAIDLIESIGGSVAGVVAIIGLRNLNWEKVLNQTKVVTFFHS